MEWLSKLLGLKDKGKYECVFIKQGEWKINNDNDSYDEYCEFQILHNKVTNEYKLKTFGYQPTAHTLYKQVFENYRGLQEGDLYYKGGKLYPHTNETIHLRPTK